MATIAISNIAWQANEDERIFEVMADLDVRNLEISPFREIADLSAVSAKSAQKITHQLSAYGIRVIALQAVLFRHPELVLFRDEETRGKTLEHLINIIDFAHQVEATRIIFGSPKNKVRGEMPYERALGLAVDFFGRLARVSQEKGITCCLEPTPEIFGADFIRNTGEAMAVIQAVSSGALKLNLDLGSLRLNEEDTEELIRTHARSIGHVHVSEPHLQIIREDFAFNQNIARLLQESSYEGAISVEMLPQPLRNKGSIRKTLSFVKKIYT